MTERPSKRQRIKVSQSTIAMTIGPDVERQNGNIFLDLEALAGEESTEEDEQEWEGIVLSSNVRYINGHLPLADETQDDDQENAVKASQSTIAMTIGPDVKRQNGNIFLDLEAL